MPIRLRLALAFTAFAALTFSIGALLFADGISSRLTSLLDAQLRAQLEQVDRSVSATTRATEPTGSSQSGGPAPGEYFFQLIDRSGRVVATSADAGREPLLDAAELAAARGGPVSFTKQAEGEHARLTAGPDRADRRLIAVAGASLESIDRTESTVTIELVVGGLVAVAIAGLAAYWLARAALRPVERMRREVAALSERDQEATIDVPTTRDEIASLAETMNTLLLRMQRALSRQRAFVADAGHELRNPFAVLQAELELASKPGRSREDLVDAVSGAADEAARLSRLADDLLLLARSDEDEMALQRTDTELSPLLGRSAEAARARAGRLGVDVRVDADRRLRAELDGDRFRRAVDNLVDNALRFSPPGSEIVLSAVAEGRDLVVEVLDGGPGFPEDYIPHAFERFRRPDASRARGSGGAGLGLSIVRSIVVAHGGSATVGNRPAGGAVVTLRLPGAVEPTGA